MRNAIQLIQLTLEILAIAFLLILCTVVLIVAAINTGEKSVVLTRTGYSAVALLAMFAVLAFVLVPLALWNGLLAYAVRFI